MCIKVHPLYLPLLLQCILQGSKFKSDIVWENCGGRIFMPVCPYFSACLKKKYGHFFTQRVSIIWQNFSGFWATWKIATKSEHMPSLHGALQLIQLLVCTSVCRWTWRCKCVPWWEDDWFPLSVNFLWIVQSQVPMASGNAQTIQYMVCTVLGWSQ